MPGPSFISIDKAVSISHMVMTHTLTTTPHPGPYLHSEEAGDIGSNEEVRETPGFFVKGSDSESLLLGFGFLVFHQ